MEREREGEEDGKRECWFCTFTVCVTALGCVCVCVRILRRISQKKVISLWKIMNLGVRRGREKEGGRERGGGGGRMREHARGVR